MTGYKSLYFTDISEIKDIKQPIQREKTVQFFTNGSFGLFETKEISLSVTPNRDAYDVEINSVFVTAEEMNAKFNQIKHERYVCVLKDNNNNYVLIGSKEEPLRFEFSFTGEDKPDKRKYYAVKFYQTTTEPPNITFLN